MSYIIKSLLVSMEKYLSTILISASFFIFAAKTDPTTLGKLNSIESLAIIFTFLSLLSLDSVVMDKAMKEPDKADQYFISIYCVKLIVSSVGYIIFLLTSVIIFNFSPIPSFIIGSLIILKSTILLQYRLITNDEIKKYMAIGLLSSITAFSLKLLVVNIDKPSYYPWFFVFDFFILFIICFATIYHQIKKTNIDLKLAFDVIYEGRLFILSSFTILAFGKVDQLMISLKLNFDDVANYSLAMKVIGAFVLIANAFNLILARDVSKAKTSSNDKYISKIRKMMLFTFALGLFMSIINLLLTPLMLQFFYGGKYAKAIELSIYATPLILLTFLSSSVGKILITEGLGGFALFRNIASLAIMIVLTLVLLPYFGLDGVLIASIISWSFSSLIFVIGYHKTRHIYLGKYKS
ncbi:hypothetical protein ACJW8E_15180 [Plesiomonas shigelloides]|uniref:hypothetical protein n=1 Tax=Plesiomonas shigelloides TaxID=703 RepID=UPI00387F3782